MAGPAWNEALTGATALRHFDKDEIKFSLPLEWVFQREGLVLTPDSDGKRLVGPCPFHNDESFNFAIFGDTFEKAGCWACDFMGDVFDVIIQYKGLDFRGALQEGGRLLEEFKLDVDWRPSSQGMVARPKIDPYDLTATAMEAWSLAKQMPTAINRLIEEKQRTEPGWEHITASFLIDRWAVGVQDDWKVTVPHYSLREDTGDRLLARAMKTRTARSHLYAETGSDLWALYGVWLDQGRDKVILCEGESDTWCCDAVASGFADVLGLPSGASAAIKPEWLARFKKRHVILAFDGDAAGRRASKRWHAALKPVAASVKIAVMPDGYDLSKLKNIMTVIMDAVAVVPAVGNIFVSKANETYVRPGKEEGAETDISNWVMEPHRELSFEDGAKAYEGRANGREVVLHADDLASDTTITRWATKAGGNWLGNKRDAQCILGLLETEGPFMAKGMATGVIGWHDGNFVWPGGRLGYDYWKWVPPVASVPTNLLHIVSEPWDPNCLKALLDLHLRDVTTPILAWLGAAPLRSLFDTFPFLAVTGSSGSGKSTLISKFLDTFGWRIESTLTATTAHGVHTTAGISNGIPVWFDEYRPGAREDALRSVQQVLRDAYDGTPSVKGGGMENRSALTAMPTMSPIIISGEDALMETSHIERAVLLSLPLRGKNPAGLKALRDTHTRSLGFAYMSWIVDRYQAGTLPSLYVDQSEGRIAANFATLHVGWNLLSHFYADVTGEDLGQPDFNRVASGIHEANSTNPVGDALSWASHSEFYGGPVVWAQGDDVYVKVVDFVRETQKCGQFILPGNRKAIGKILDENWFGVDTIHHVYGHVKVLVGMAQVLAGAASES